MNMKTNHSSFEGKIKKSFRNYSLVLTVILFCVLMFFIAFERILLPKIQSHNTLRSVKENINELNEKVDSLFLELDKVESNSKFYEIYYRTFIGKGLKGDISIYDSDNSPIYMTRPSNDGSVLNRIYNCRTTTYFINKGIQKSTLSCQIPNGTTD